jgi:hypothetical protein
MFSAKSRVNLEDFVVSARKKRLFLTTPSIGIIGGIYLTPVDTTGSIWGNGRLPTDTDGVRTAIFIGRSVSGIFGGSSMAGGFYMPAMPSS